MPTNAPNSKEPSGVRDSLLHLPRHLLAFLILLYQKTLSFDHGPLHVLYPYGFCPFYPSCSEYARQSIGKYGVLKGSVYAFRRLLRCNPFTKGGIDLP